MKYNFSGMFIGNSNVGKTTLVSKYIDNDLNIADIRPTIGMDFTNKNVYVDSDIVSLSLFDISGQDKFKQLIYSQIEKSKIVIIVYDITNLDSFNNMFEYLLFNNMLNKKVILVGNKNDLQNRIITTKHGQRIADKYGIRFCETSINNMDDFNELMLETCNEIVHDINIEDLKCHLIGKKNKFCYIL